MTAGSTGPSTLADASPKDPFAPPEEPTESFDHADLTETATVEMDDTSEEGRRYHAGSVRTTLADADGKPVGSTEARILAFAAPDGSLWQYYQYVGQLPDGEVAGGALLSIGAVIAGEPQRFPAVGVSGDLLGAVGTYEFVLLRRDPDGSTVFSSAFHLRR